MCTRAHMQTLTCSQGGWLMAVQRTPLILSFCQPGRMCRLNQTLRHRRVQHPCYTSNPTLDRQHHLGVLSTLGTWESTTKHEQTTYSPKAGKKVSIWAHEWVINRQHPLPELVQGNNDQVLCWANTQVKVDPLRPHQGCCMPPAPCPSTLTLG